MQPMYLGSYHKKQYIGKVRLLSHQAREPDADRSLCNGEFPADNIIALRDV